MRKRPMAVAQTLYCCPTLLAMFQSVEFSDRTGNPLFTCEDVALNLKRMLRMSNNLLCPIQSAWKILLSGNQHSLRQKSQLLLMKIFCKPLPPRLVLLS